MAEFAKLREEVQKKSLAAKAAGQRKVAREEMCKHVTVYSAAELKWVEYAEANVTSCGIPVQIVHQLKEMHGHTEQTKEKICASTPGLRRDWLRVLFRVVSGRSAAWSPKSTGRLQG